MFLIIEQSEVATAKKSNQERWRSVRVRKTSRPPAAAAGGATQQTTSYPHTERAKDLNQCESGAEREREREWPPFRTTRGIFSLAPRANWGARQQREFIV